MADINRKELEDALYAVVYKVNEDLERRSTKPRSECLLAMQQLYRELEKKIDKLITAFEAFSVTITELREEIDEHAGLIAEHSTSISALQARCSQFEEFVTKSSTKEQRFQTRKEDLVWGSVGAVVKWGAVAAAGGLVAWIIAVNEMKHETEGNHRPGIEVKQ